MRRGSARTGATPTINATVISRFPNQTPTDGASCAKLSRASHKSSKADWPCFLPAWSIAGTPGNQHSAGRSVVIPYDDVKPVVAKPDHRRAFECGDKHEGPSTPLLELQHDGLRPRINDEAFALALVIGAAALRHSPRVLSTR